MEAKPDGCQEVNFLVPSLPCNHPATRLIGWPKRGEGPYRMCEACADHSIHNRGATDMGAFPGRIEKITVLLIKGIKQQAEVPAPFCLDTYHEPDDDSTRPYIVGVDGKLDVTALAELIDKELE